MSKYIRKVYKLPESQGGKWGVFALLSKGDEQIWKRRPGQAGTLEATFPSQQKALDYVKRYK